MQAKDETPEVVVVDPGDSGADQSEGHDEAVEQPAKVMRIGSMVKQLLDEVRAAPIDEQSRIRLREIYEQSVRELADSLSPDLAHELDRMTLAFRRQGSFRGRAANSAGPAGRVARRTLPRDPGNPGRPTDGCSGSARRNAPKGPAFRRTDPGPRGSLSVTSSSDVELRLGRHGEPLPEHPAVRYGRMTGL